MGERGTAWEADQKALESVGIDVVYPLHNTTHTRSIAYCFFNVNRVLAFLAIENKTGKFFRELFQKINDKFTILNGGFAAVNASSAVLNEK